MIGRLLFTLYWLLLRWSWTVRRSGKLPEVTRKSTANKYRIRVTNLKWEHIQDIFILRTADLYYLSHTKKHNPLLICQVESGKLCNLKKKTIRVMFENLVFGCRISCVYLSKKTAINISVFLWVKFIYKIAVQKFGNWHIGTFGKRMLWLY
jgi:hypothetical protein